MFLVILSLVLVVIIAMIIAAAFNWTIERVAYRPLRGSFRLAPLISAIGMSIVLQEYVRIAQDGRPKPLQPIVTGGHVIMERAGDQGEFIVRLSNMQIFIIITRWCSWRSSPPSSPAPLWAGRNAPASRT